MKIAIGKIGKSIQFGPERNRTGKAAMTSGSIDARIVFEKLIEHNPQHEFYIVGRSNYYRLDDDVRDIINQHGNVHDMWDEFFEWRDRQEDLVEQEEGWRYVDYMLENKLDFDLDVGLFFAGGMFEYNVQGKTLRDGKPIKALMAAAVYAAPVHHFINETKLPWIALVTDPRCFPTPTKDIFVPPVKVLGQFNETMEITHKTSYEGNEEVTDEVEAIYSGIESLYAIEEPTYNESTLAAFFEEEEVEEERDINMILFLNEGTPSRYEDLKKYVLNDIEDVKVYGSWKEKILEDPRIEKVAMVTLSHLFPRIRYTFCIPIKTGWATGKFWDMINMGIVPFFHPDYDVQKNIGFPEELRVKDSKDLLEKISLYNNDEMEYNKIVGKLQAMITPDHRSGKFITDMIMKNIEEVVNAR